MKILLSMFLGVGALLWLLSFGYILFLYFLVKLHKSKTTVSIDTPTVVVVIPTLNEEQWIDRKLDNLKELNYPAHRIRTIIVDGGSKDGTLDRVYERIKHGEAMQLIAMNDCTGKAAQINRVLAEVNEDIVVVTDADTSLEPSSIGFLVGHLESEPRTGIVGAMVEPETPLIEEQIHWSFLNLIWWLEGEVWSSPGMSGVCYAMRRTAFSKLLECVKAEDVRLALDAAARGYRVRICRQARVREMRVPKTFKDYLRFRCQRGRRYLTELSRSYPDSTGLWVWKIGQRIRRMQMTWVPIIAVVFVILAGILSASPEWPWVLGVASWFGLFSLSFMIYAHRFSRHSEEVGLVRWSLIGIRFALLTLISLLFIKTLIFCSWSGDRSRSL